MEKLLNHPYTWEQVNEFWLEESEDSRIDYLNKYWYRCGFCSRIFYWDKSKLYAVCKECDEKNLM